MGSAEFVCFIIIGNQKYEDEGVKPNYPWNWNPKLDRELTEKYNYL